MNSRYVGAGPTSSWKTACWAPGKATGVLPLPAVSAAEEDGNDGVAAEPASAATHLRDSEI